MPPFSKAAEKTWSCFSLDTEQQYWTVTVLKKVNLLSMTSNVLPLHFAYRQASSRSNLLSLIKFFRLYLLKSLVTFWVSRMLTDKTNNIKSNFVYHLRNTAMPIHFRLTFYAESSQHCSIFAQIFFHLQWPTCFFQKIKKCYAKQCKSVFF